MSGENWWFQKQSDVLFVDEDLQRVGVLNENPTTTLDVEGTIQGSNVVATDVVEGLVVNAGSNLMWQGYSLYDPCPADANIWNDVIPFKADEGMIHYSWIRRPTDAATVFEDIYNLVAAGVELYTIIKAVSDLLAGRTFADAVGEALPAAITGAASGAIAGALTQALSDLFDNADDLTNNSNAQARISWYNLKNRPLATIGNDVGIQGNLFVNTSQKLQLLNDTSFQKDVFNNTTFFSAGSIDSGSTLIDFGSKTAYLNSLYFKNDIVCSNVATIRTDNNGVLAFNSNTLTYGTVNPTLGQVQNVIGIDRTGLSLYTAPKLLGSNETYTKPDGLTYNNYGRLEYSISNGLRYGVGLCNNIGTNYNIFTVSKDGNLTTTGNIFCASNITFSNTATILANQKGTQWLNGKSYDAKGLTTTTFNRFTYGQILQDQQFPQSNIVRPVFDVQPEQGFSLYGRPALLGSNEIVQITNVNNPLGAPLTLSNYGRFEYGLSNGLTYGYGYSNDVLNNNYDLLKYTNNGILYTFDSSTNTLVQMTDRYASLRRGGMTITKDGILTSSQKAQFTSNVDVTTANILALNIGNMRIDSTGISCGNKKIFDANMKMILGECIDYTANEFQTVYFRPVSPQEPQFNPFTGLDY